MPINVLGDSAGSAKPAFCIEAPKQDLSRCFPNTLGKHLIAFSVVMMRHCDSKVELNSLLAISATKPTRMVV